MGPVRKAPPPPIPKRVKSPLVEDDTTSAPAWNLGALSADRPRRNSDCTDGSGGEKETNGHKEKEEDKLPEIRIGAKGKSEIGGKGGRLGGSKESPPSTGRSEKDDKTRSSGKSVLRWISEKNVRHSGGAGANGETKRGAVRELIDQQYFKKN